MDSTSSTFRIPILLPPPSQTETLLFNDIIEEKTKALRTMFTEFLLVQPYHKFHAEFSNFIKRTKRIIQEGHRNGTSITRTGNSTEIAPVSSRPSSTVYKPQTSLSVVGTNIRSAFRPQTTLSVVGSNSRSAFRIPEPIEQSNTQSRNPEVNIVPTEQLSRTDSSVNDTSSLEPPPICPTINEESQNNSTSNPPVVSITKPKPKPTRNSYSDVTVVGEQNNLQNNDDDSSSIESLLDNAGFKIIIGMPDGSNKSKNASQVKSENPTFVNGEKYLSKWSVNVKLINSVYSKKIVLAITGSLLKNDQMTVEEKFHDAGLLEGRRENNLIKTTNGLYRLIGNIIGGSPNELYHVCLEIRGIPRTWRNILKKLSDTKKDNKNATLNLTLESPAGPSITRKNIKPIADVNVTRRGSLLNAHKNIVAVEQKNNTKRKNPENDSSYIQTNKQRKLTKQLPSLMMTSTPFKVTKTRTRTFVKPETPEKTNSSKQALGNSKAGSSKQSSCVNKTLNSDITTRSMKHVKSASVNTSKKANNTLGIDKSTKTVKVENLKGPTLVKNSRVVNKTTKNVKVVKPTKKETIKNVTTRVTKQEGKKISERKVTKKENSKKPKKKSPKRAEIGLFDNVDFSAYGDMSDFNVMAMPSATYTDTSRSAGSSRSDTPPLFGHQWSKSGKSIAMSEGPSILSKSLEAKALKNRIKAPKITLEEQLKNNKKLANIKVPILTDYKKVTNQINQMLQFGEQFDYDDDSSFESPL